MNGIVDTDTCSRCGAAIIDTDGFRRPLIIQFTIPANTDGPLYDEEVRVLCSGCEEDLLAWVDGESVDHSDRVDLPDRLQSADTLIQVADELEAIANDLETGLQGDTDDG